MSEPIIQGSPEWHALRCGRVTASRVADIVAKTKSGYSTSRANYLAELLVERLTSVSAPSFISDAMRWGTEKEPEARAAYCFIHEADIEEVGFVHHPRIAMAGASPDGLVGADGLIEVKCPLTATHIETLTGRSVPGRYITQIQWQLACTGRAWCDFVSYDPRMPQEMRLFVQRVPRAEATIAELEAEVSGFLSELDAKLAQLQSIYGQREAA